MTGIYLCSLQPGAGKTALAAALARKLAGQDVGYLRLSDGAFAGADADFLARATGAYVSPITEAGGALHQAYQILARDRGVVLVEGQANLGEAVGIEACRQSLEATGAQAVIVTRYAPAFSLQPLCRAAEKLSPHVAGVVVNVIPQAKREWAVGTLAPELGREGLTPLALLPEVWRLYGVSVGQMAEHLEGDIITCPEAADEIVENLAVGPMAVDPAPHHLGRKAHKAVVTRANRVDIQLGALPTHTVCFVLCGPEYPAPDILIETQKRGIAIIRTERGVVPTLDLLEGLFSRVRFHQAKKLPPWEELLAQHLDFARLFSRLGLQT